MLVRKRKNREAEIPTSSLADIAFLLLIFFLVTTTIDVDKGIGLVLPAKGETKAVRSQNITNLLINAQGEVLIDDNPIDVNLVKNVIQKKITERPNLVVSVKTDQDTQYWVYIRVLDQLKQANASRISIAEPEQ
ncbi:biopolymer transporter ExbD [bacterium]|nr:biopolymer transporter ExbD [candidate division CSSED10-310 bacterium]